MNSPQVHKKKNINVVEAKDNLYCEEEGVK